MNRALAALAALLCLIGSASAELGKREIRPGAPAAGELVVQSETVVVAAPVGPAAPERFQTLRVLLGSGLKEGDLFEVDGLILNELTFFEEERGQARKPVRVKEALLFLGPGKPGPAIPRRPLTPSGLRVLTAEGTVCFASRDETRGDYFLFKYRAGVVWDDLIRKAEADAVEVSHIRSLKAIDDPHRRNEALLGWVERHRHEFGGGLSMSDGGEPTFGWGSLEQDVFAWVFESHLPQDCWEAIKRYAELNQGWTPWLRTAAFGTRAGRQLLSSVALDDAALAGHRARALELLALPATLWPPPTWLVQPGAEEPVDKEEQAKLIEWVTPLLKNADPRIRSGAARALLEASSPMSDSLQSFHTDRALPALTAAYQAEPPGRTRDALAEAVAVLAEPERWEELSGNARGIVVVLDPYRRQGAEAYCYVVAPKEKDGIPGRLTLVFERLDDKGKVAEKKELPLEHTKDVVWPSERGVIDCREFEFSLADYTPGVWRMTVKGVAGDDKAAWTSEPRLLHLAPRPKPDQPNFDPSAPRIVFDP